MGDHRQLIIHGDKAMHIMQRKRGEQFLVGDDISIVVLEIDRCGVKFGICSMNAGSNENARPALGCNVRCSGPGYYMFPQRGCCTFVVSCEQGKTLFLNDTAEFTVRHIEDRSVTLAID